MSKLNNKTIDRALSLGAAVSAAVVIISMFLDYIKLSILGVTTSATGFDLYDGDNTTNKILLTLTLILCIAVIALAVLRILGMFNNKLFTLIFAAAGAALLVVSIILFITVAKQKVAGLTIEYDRAIGLILNFIFSIIAALCCAGAFIMKK